jgi:hypothetical protein
MCETAAGIFVWSAWGLYNTIKRDMFKHNDFSHDWVPSLIKYKRNQRGTVKSISMYL